MTMSNTTLTKQQASTSPTHHGSDGAEKIDRRAVYAPRFDIYSTDERVVLQGDIPGVAADGLDIQYDDGVLTIFAKVHDRASDGRPMLLREYGVGDFQRSFRIHQDVDVDTITATLDGGVLTLELPISE